MPLRLVMMATGTFALPTFRALYDSEHTVVGLYTQPDRTGRGHHRHANELKELALQHSTPVFQPERINTPEDVQTLADLNADLCVVAAYGQILSAKLLQTPRLGAINLHGSLLPKYRGAAPIQYALLNGESETGVSIFQIEPKLDAGPVYGMVSMTVPGTMTAGELHDELAELCVPLTLEIIDQLENGTASGIEQDPNLVSHAPKLTKTDGLIDWTRSPRGICDQVRAMLPWPKPFSFLHHGPNADPQRLIIHGVSIAADDPDTDPEPGTILIADGKRLVVQANGGAVEIHELQPPGKRKMTSEEFQRGHALAPGDRFGAESP